MTEEKKREISDLGTSEISRHHIVAPEMTYTNSPRARVVDQREIDRMLLRDLISLDEHHTLERVGEDARRASGSSLIGCYDPRVSRGRDPQFVSDGKSEACRHFLYLQRAVQESAGYAALAILIDLAAYDIRPKKNSPLHEAIHAADLYYLSHS